MNSKFKRNITISSLLFFVFIIFTVLVKIIDVKSWDFTQVPDFAGDLTSEIGFSTLNISFFNLLSKYKLNYMFHDLSEILGYVAILVAFFIALKGIAELLKVKSFKKINQNYYLLAAFYCVVVFFYIIFEVIVINCRPVIIDNTLEASYPSSHTLLSVCIFISAMYVLKNIFSIKKKYIIIANVALFIMAISTVVFRTLSNIHWLTDIIGGVLLSVSLLSFYFTFACLLNSKKDALK